MQNINLDLANAFATWVQDKDDNKWIIFNQDNERLGDLPANIDEHVAMAAIRLGRKYELKAFNTGIDYGKSIKARDMQPVLDGLNNRIKELEAMNLRLSSKLEQFIIGQDED